MFRICMSHELSAGKGSYVVLAGVFNYWTYDLSSVFARKLSEEFGCAVMHMCWDEENDTVQCQVWLSGQLLCELDEGSIARILRRIM